MGLKPGSRISQNGTENSLEIDHCRRQDRKPLDARRVGVLDLADLLLPLPGREKRQARGEREKSLGETGMQDRQGLFDQDHSKTTDDSLKDDESEGDDSEPAQPPALLIEPQQNR